MTTNDLFSDEITEMQDFFKKMDAEIAKAQAMTKYDYRVRRKDGTFVNAGTDEPSWFTIEQAREIAKKGDVILLLGELETL